jgi:hypothetical protein
MLFSDILPYLLTQQQAAGPMLPPALAKAASNASAVNVPSAKIPGPYDFLTAMTSAANVAGENRLREQQVALTDAQRQQLMQQLKLGEGVPGLVANILSGNLSGSTGGSAATVPAPSSEMSVGGGSDLGHHAASPSSTEVLAGPHGDVIRDAAERYSLDPHLIAGVVSGESGDKSNSVNKTTGAAGLGNLMPSTAEGLGVKDIFNAGQNVNGVAAYLRQGLDKYGGDTNKALMYYYGGPNEKIWGPKTTAYPDYIKARMAVQGTAPAPQPVAGASQSAGQLQQPLSEEEYRRAYPGGILGGPREGGQLPPTPVAQFNEAARNRLAQGDMPTGVGQVGLPDVAGLRAPQTPQNFTMSPLQAAIAALGVQARAAKLGDIATPLEQAFYNSPYFKAQQAGASAAATLPADVYKQRSEQLAKYLGPEANPGLQEQLAAAKGRGEFSGPNASPELQGAIQAAKERAGYQGPLADVGLQSQLAGGKKSAEAEARRPYSLEEQRFKTALDIAASNNKPVETRPGQSANVNPYRFPIPMPPAQLGGPIAAGTTLQPGPQSALPPTSRPGEPQFTPGGGLVFRGLDPGEQERSVERAKREEHQRQITIDEGAAAQGQKATLLTMENEAGRFNQGPFAPYEQIAGKYLRYISPSWNEPVASYENFIKNAGNLTRQAVRETSSRAAVQEFSLIQNTLPAPETSPLGFRRINNELIGLNDYKVAKAQAQGLWESEPAHNGSVAGFETAFQKLAAPMAFVVARMHPEDQKELFAKLQTSDQGRRELARLGEQLKFIKQAGLEQ